MPRIPFDPAADYYQLLGVPPGASPDEIQAAYRRLAKAFHPDLHADSAVAAARMAGLNIAKSVLLDADVRASYDQFRVNGRRAANRVAARPPSAPPSVRYAPQQPGGRPRHRVGSYGAAGRRATHAAFDRQTAILLLVAVPLIAALVVYVFQAVQLSIQPLRPPPSDLNLFGAPSGGRPTTHGAADAVFVMVDAQPPSRELAIKAYNFIMARSDSTPESELLRADARRLLRSANADDTVGWDSTVADLCHLAGRC